MRTSDPLFIPHYSQGFKPIPNIEMKFYLTDSEEFFRKHHEVLGDHWRYADREIIYKFNSLGYRSEELDFYKDKDFALVLGASDVLGLGLAENEIWHHYIKQELGLEILNAGFISGSPDIQMLNTLLFIKNSGLTPKCVIIQWPELNRFTLKGNNSTTYLLPEIFDDKELKFSSFFIQEFINNFRNTRNNNPMLNFYRTWINDNNSVNNAQIFIEITRLLWNLTNIPYYDFILDNENLLEKDLDLDNYNNLICDLARDQLHHGYQTHQNIGLKVIEKMKIIL